MDADNQRRRLKYITFLILIGFITIFASGYFLRVLLSTEKNSHTITGASKNTSHVPGITPNPSTNHPQPPQASTKFYPAVKNILDNDSNIPTGTIGIFPNASPEFAAQYPKCNGMIFLKGGQTSHGAIVAREFEIPAIIDNKISGIEDGTQISINATIGEWTIII